MRWPEEGFLRGRKGSLRWVSRESLSTTSTERSSDRGGSRPGLIEGARATNDEKQSPTAAIQSVTVTRANRAPSRGSFRATGKLFDKSRVRWVDQVVYVEDNTSLGGSGIRGRGGLGCPYEAFKRLFCELAMCIEVLSGEVILLDSNRSAP